jgi:hypothetical protein
MAGLMMIPLLVGCGPQDDGPPIRILSLNMAQGADDPEAPPHWTSEENRANQALFLSASGAQIVVMQECGAHPEEVLPPGGQLWKDDLHDNCVWIAPGDLETVNEWMVPLSYGPGDQPRTSIHVRLRRGDREFTVMGTHLSTESDWAPRQFAQATARTPEIAIGDFNVDWAGLAGGVPYTLRRVSPTKEIDGAYVTSRIGGVATLVPTVIDVSTPVSDHPYAVLLDAVVHK